MKAKRILCPIDFSTSNQAANEYASMLIEAGGTIFYLHVMPPDIPLGMYGYDTVMEAEQEQAELEKFHPTQPGIEAKHTVRAGNAAETIISFAKEKEIDLIVMSTHGRTGVSRVLMGSVAELVVRKAACPVLAIKSQTIIAQAF